MKKYTAGDLETAIQQVWQTSDDLELFFRYHGDVSIPMTEDEIANALLGLKMLHDMRIWHVQDMHCRVFELNQYCTDPEKLAVRDDVFGDVEAYLNKKKKGSKK
jgi:hypothetical protein